MNLMVFGLLVVAVIYITVSLIAVMMELLVDIVLVNSKALYS